MRPVDIQQVDVAGELGERLTGERSHVANAVADPGPAEV